MSPSRIRRGHCPEFSWPAVSQICNFIILFSTSTVLIFCIKFTKSTPIVAIKLSVYVLSENLNKRLDLPTPESPIRSSLNK